MRIINLSQRTSKDWSGQFVDDTYYDELLNEDCTVYKPDGSILMVLRKNILSKPILAEAWSVLKGYNPSTNNRGVAAGSGYARKVKQDGTLSKTNRATDTVASGIIGYFERSVRFPYCRACAWNLSHPEEWGKLLPLVQEVSQLFEQNVPGRYLQQAEIIRRTSTDFVIPGSVYTTLTVNKTFRTACHRDAGDLPEGISGMVVIREGKYSGARLVFPDFRKAVHLDTGDLIFFDPHEFHGNTKIVELTPNAVRCSIVFYYREKIQHCKSAIEELERAKTRVKGDALTDHNDA